MSGERVDLETPAFAWSSGKYHGMGGAREVRGTYLYVLLTFVAAAFHGGLQVADEGQSATLTLADGRTLQFARGGIGCVLDGRMTSMQAEAVFRDGVLCALEWIAANVLDLRVSTHSGVTYVTDHHAELSGNMARPISDLLG